MSIFFTKLYYSCIFFLILWNILALVSLILVNYLPAERFNILIEQMVWFLSVQMLLSLFICRPPQTCRGNSRSETTVYYRLPLGSTVRCWTTTAGFTQPSTYEMNIRSEKLNFHPWIWYQLGESLLAKQICFIVNMISYTLLSSFTPGFEFMGNKQFRIKKKSVFADWSWFFWKSIGSLVLRTNCSWIMDLRKI